MEQMQYLTIEQAKKLANYDKLETLYKMEKSNNQLLAKQNEELQKNYMATNRLKDKEIRELKDKIDKLEPKQMTIFDYEEDANIWS